MALLIVQYNTLYVCILLLDLVKEHFNNGKPHDVSDVSDSLNDEQVRKLFRKLI